MRLTILIPTVNRPKMVRELVESITRFELDFVDICVSLNGADIKTVNALTPFKEKGKIDLLIWHDLLPISKHWDLAIKSVSNELILVLPDDDKLINPNWLLEIKGYFEKNTNAVIGFGNYEKVDSNGHHLGEVSVSVPSTGTGSALLEIYKSKFQGYNGFGLPNLCTVFKKNAYHECGGIDIECVSPDTYLFCKVLSAGDYVFSNQIAAKYMIHEDNLSKSINLRLLLSDVKMAIGLTKYLVQKGKLPNSWWAIRFVWFFIRRFLGALRRQVLPSGN